MWIYKRDVFYTDLTSVIGFNFCDRRHYYTITRTYIDSSEICRIQGGNEAIAVGFLIPSYRKRK